MNTYVIAEAGSCHDGLIGKAVGLIDVARDAGADACKFQYWSSADRLAERRRAPEYRDLYAKYQVPRHWLSQLSEACRLRGLDFLCTTYLPEDIETVHPYVTMFKVASFEAGDTAFVDAHRRFGKPIIVSCGMGAQPPIDTVRLHCVSAYPAPIEEANLARIRAAGLDGFSDHTCHVLTGALAVAAGARFIEVHIRDWATDRGNPDFGTALDPAEFRYYVDHIREAERMLGDGERRVAPSEAAMACYRVTA